MQIDPPTRTGMGPEAWGLRLQGMRNHLPDTRPWLCLSLSVPLIAAAVSADPAPTAAGHLDAQTGGIYAAPTVSFVGAGFIPARILRDF